MPRWKVNLLAIGLTAAFAVFTAGALILVLAGDKIGAFLDSWSGYQDSFTVAWNLVRWPFAVFAVLFTINLLYRFAPDLKQ
jgi:uncharacterized BrkB/YihY/UPF0761 family membrane protein